MDGFLVSMDRGNSFNILKKELQIILPMFTFRAVQYFTIEEHSMRIQTVQWTGTMPVTRTIGTVLSAEQSVGTVRSADFQIQQHVTARLTSSFRESC